MRRLPPSLGGLTVGDQSLPMHWENCQISQRWLNPSSPRSASEFRYSGSNITRAVRLSTSPALARDAEFGSKIAADARDNMDRHAFAHGWASPSSPSSSSTSDRLRMCHWLFSLTMVAV